MRRILLFYTEDSETGYRTYYQLIDGILQISKPETHVTKGSILLGNLQGVMSHDKELFRGAAQGYIWDYGFADTYISLIGNHYAAYYKEPENEVYLLNLVDGRMQLLEGIPASHNISLFWNPEFSMLSISIHTESGASRLAFFIPGTDAGWYFDRIPSESVNEVSASWYSEYGYFIQAVSPERDQYYLYLYEYTP